MSKYAIIVLILCTSIFTVNAQEATEEPDEASHRVQAWTATYTDEGGSALLDPDTGEAVMTYVAFLEFEDGLISVWGGADFVYTLNEDDDGFTGHYLIPDPDISVTANLTIVDEDTRTEIQSVDLFGTEQLSYVTYTRTDETVEIWSESPRNFIETTMLGECLGRTSVTLSFGWVAPDLLMPIYFADDGTIVMDYRVYEGGENQDISTRPMVDGSSTTTVVIRSLDVGAGSIAFNLHGTIDERDDCEMIYESTFTPFDADFDTIFEQAEAVSIEFERE